MKVLEDIHKYLSLIMSDKISALLKINFDLKDIQCQQEEYQMFVSDVAKFSYISLFKLNNRGILLLIDPKLIYILCNRMLGGKGIIETKPRPVITTSEDLMGKRLVGWFYDFYKESKLDISFLRVENDINLIHFFYPDEMIYSVKLNCKINMKATGAIKVCYPGLIMDKKESSWGV